METFGVSSNLVGRVSDAGTGTVKVIFDGDGQPQYTIHRPAAYDFLRLDEPALSTIVTSRPDFLYFGTLSQLYPNNLAALVKLIDALPDCLCFYDINLRRESFNLALVTQLMFRAQVVKMNEDETRAVQELFGTSASTLEEFCRSYSRKFGWRAAWITLGAAGCAVFHEGSFLQFPGFPVASASPVGAGDAFSAAVCHGILGKWPIPKIAEFANKLGALTARQPGAVCEWTMQDIESIPIT
jgi:fructokinase